MTNEEKALEAAMVIKEEIGISEHSISRVAEIIYWCLTWKDQQFREYLDNKNNMREVICIKDCRKDGLAFVKGCTYKVDYNSVDGRLYIYTVWGYTDISKSMLNEYFF